MPVILWHLWRFIAPGLTAGERRAILPWIPMALVFFALGVGVAYVVLPYVSGSADATLDGNPIGITRAGLADPRVRLSWSFLGAPALGRR